MKKTALRKSATKNKMIVTPDDGRAPGFLYLIFITDKS